MVSNLFVLPLYKGPVENPNKVLCGNIRFLRVFSPFNKRSRLGLTVMKPASRSRIKTEILVLVNYLTDAPRIFQPMSLMSFQYDHSRQ